MTPQRLSWRIGLPFAAFVLSGSIALVALMFWSIANEELARFEQLARTNADFMNKMKLPPSPRMADELRQVLGVRVMFRKDRVLTPEPTQLTGVPDLPANGQCHVLGTMEAVIVPLDSGHELVLVRPKFAYLGRGWIRSILPVLGAFWGLALLVAWLISRSLVRPLRHLAARLPEIEKPGALELPEAGRMDEIGDVARAFVRTRGALQIERAERERAEKLAVLGRMTAALAHEIQNPLSAIKLHAQLLPGGNEAAEVIASETLRIEGMVNQWMFLSRPEPPVMMPLALGRILTASLSAHRLQLEHAQVRPESSVEDDFVILGDQRRLAQVFSNLIMNAIQAMPRGGVLRIGARRAGDATVELSFADSGPGFSDAALARFADFFFSEKEGGMGIGLSVASEIVKAHGGELGVENRAEGGGARVTVRLPLERGPSVREPTPVAD